ncbi:MAG: DUF1549 and DUF1553 domain-containing protein [Gemmataceae bacterium]
MSRSFLALAVCLFYQIAIVQAQSTQRRLREPVITSEDREHWAFRSPVRFPLPKVRQSLFVETSVDHFLLSRLEEEGLTFSQPTDRSTWLRRVTVDLIGLPPTPKEIDAFRKDECPGAYERVVERLLASPHYGEHWALGWLDLVRYAESNGYETDRDRPHAWRYRDYVIDSFNTDKPYDRFLTEQIAGDELVANWRGSDSLESRRSPHDHSSLLFAAGFHRCGPVHVVSGNVDKDEIRNEIMTEMTDAIGFTFLGLTLGCARCHNHKFDPISQADYYRLQAFFANTQPKDIPLASKQETARYEKAVAALNSRIQPLTRQVTQLESPIRDRIAAKKRKALAPDYLQALETPASERTSKQKQIAKDAKRLVRVRWDEILAAMTPEQRKRKASLRSEIHSLRASMPSPPTTAWTVENSSDIPDTYLLLRGNWKRKVGKVQTAFPRVLVSDPKSRPTERLTRTQLARWLTSPDHPLTARVMVNRIWQHHFGQGIVATPNDFGTRGAKPTHPQLLDWLATEFVRSGWSIKHMHRLMVLSRAYQQRSRVSNKRAKGIDPGNKMLWRMNRRRLTGEEIRDGILAASGTLTRKVGGPMVRVPLEKAVYDLIFTEGEPDGLWLPHPDPTEHARRSIYLFTKRNVRLPVFEMFDQPDRVTSCPKRSRSTYAPQALILMNGPLAQEQKRRLALRLVRECGNDREEQINRLFLLAYGRRPRMTEARLCLRMLAKQTQLLRQEGRQGGDLYVEALSDVCLAIFNSNEFVYVR